MALSCTYLLLPYPQTALAPHVMPSPAPAALPCTCPCCRSLFNVLMAKPLAVIHPAALCDTMRALTVAGDTGERRGPGFRVEPVHWGGVYGFACAQGQGRAAWLHSTATRVWIWWGHTARACRSSLRRLKPTPSHPRLSPLPLHCLAQVFTNSNAVRRTLRTWTPLLPPTHISVHGTPASHCCLFVALPAPVACRLPACPAAHPAPPEQ